jgi:hypothetical protein
MGAAAAAATSITGAGLGAYAQILSSKGTAAGMNYKASALESAAQRGRVGAAQTGASETEKLVTTLATRCARLPTPTLRRDRGGNPGLERNAGPDQEVDRCRQHHGAASRMIPTLPICALPVSMRCLY